MSIPASLQHFRMDSCSHASSIFDSIADIRFMTVPFSFAPASFEELWCGATGVSTTSTMLVMIKPILLQAAVHCSCLCPVSDEASNCFTSRALSHSSMYPKKSPCEYCACDGMLSHMCWLQQHALEQYVWLLSGFHCETR